jgi:hypothetical protein
MLEEIVNIILGHASAQVQVTMSMVCKQWAALARTYSLRYNTLGQAIRADCSVAISRFLADGRAHGGGDLTKLSKRQKYLEQGNSIAFARAVDRKVKSYIPYCFVKTRGMQYVHWLEKNKKMPRYLSARVIGGLIGGHPKIVAQVGRDRWRPSEAAAILIMNGHGSLCWKLAPREIELLMKLHRWMDLDTLMGVMDIYKQVLSGDVPCAVIVRLYTECPQRVPVVMPCGLYFCKSQEQADALDRFRGVVFTMQGICGGAKVSERGAVAIFSRTQNFSVLEGVKITDHHYKVRILPENVGRMEEILGPHIRLICVSCHEFMIHP